jgi:hypothetical protein
MNHFLLAVASQLIFSEPVLKNGGRSCLPLRDSSGFSPDSPISLRLRLIGNAKEISTGFGQAARCGATSREDTCGPTCRESMIVNSGQGG